MSNVVELEGVARRAIYQSGERHRSFLAHSPERGDAARAFGHREVRDLASPRQRRAVKHAADRVEHAELDSFDDVLRKVVELQTSAEAREIARGVFE